MLENDICVLTLQVGDIRSQGATSTDSTFEFKGAKYTPGPNAHWKTTIDGMKKLAQKGRIEKLGNSIGYVRYFDDFPYSPLTNYWLDTANSYREKRVYTVQTSETVIERCMLMTTDPGDLVFDPTCGSGTTASVAEKWGRKWITCDTSRVSIAIAKQRLLTNSYDYFELAHPEEGVDSGFLYNKAGRVTLGSIANDERPESVALYDDPVINQKKARVSGPFTVEAVPAPAVRALNSVDVNNTKGANIEDWINELLKSGVRTKNKAQIKLQTLEVSVGTKWIHADGRTNEEIPQRVVVSFGPDFAPFEQRQVELAIQEAEKLKPSPTIIIFAAFQFDPEAAKDIDELEWGGVTILKVQMNADLFTSDLKKKRVTNESFWLIGQPEIAVERIKTGKDSGKFQVSVNGFDYYNPISGSVDSGGPEQIAMWMLDSDYDGRSLMPRQVFFPMAGPKDGWAKIVKTLKNEIDEDLIQSYSGTQSLPFESGDNKKIAIKIIDDRGIESLIIQELPQ